jgi:hypothetical protein
MMENPRFDAVASGAIIRVGDGRGFVLATPKAMFDKAVIVTAAHCLPHLPEGFKIGHAHERIYAGLLGPLGSTEPTVTAECVFCDPVGDVAVLAGPDNQKLCDEAQAYEELIGRASPLRAAAVTHLTSSEAWLFTLGERWASCIVISSQSWLWISKAAEPIEGGMSGSPILDGEGRAIGVLCASEGFGDGQHAGGGPNPNLLESLPGWLLRQLRPAGSRVR